MSRNCVQSDVNAARFQSRAAPSVRCTHSAGKQRNRLHTGAIRYARPYCSCGCALQVGAVTLICTLCFCLRALFKALSTVKSDEFGLNVLQHPFLNIAFYCFVELIPAAAVLFILRKLPPKRSATPIHATHMQAQADIEAARPAAS